MSYGLADYEIWINVSPLLRLGAHLRCICNQKATPRLSAPSAASNLIVLDNPRSLVGIQERRDWQWGRTRRRCINNKKSKHSYFS